MIKKLTVVNIRDKPSKFNYLILCFFLKLCKQVQNPAFSNVYTLKAF